METARSPRFLGNPLPHLPCSMTPVGSARQTNTTRQCCPRPCDGEGPNVYHLSRLNRTASAVAAYASRPLVAQGRARLASGCWSALPCGACTHRVTTAGFQVLCHLSPLSRLSLARHT